MPTFPFDPSNLSKLQKRELQQKYPGDTNINSGSPEMSSALGNQAANLMGQQPGFNLLGSPFAGSQMQTAGAMGAGGMPQANLFGSDEFGNPKYQLPSSEPREYFGPFKKQVEDKRAGSFEELFGKDSRLDNRSKGSIFEAQASGKITKEQAQSLAGRIQDYYDTKTQGDIFSSIIGKDSPVEEKPKPKPVRTRAPYYGNPYDFPGGTSFGGGTVKNTYL